VVDKTQILLHGGMEAFVGTDKTWSGESIWLFLARFESPMY